MTAMLADSSSAWPVDFKGRPSQWTSRVVTAASSSEVRTVDFQPFVEQRPGWLGAVVDRVQMMDEAGVDVSESAGRSCRSCRTRSSPERLSLCSRPSREAAFAQSSELRRSNCRLRFWARARQRRTS
jgi:hypothetical protein